MDLIELDLEYQTQKVYSVLSLTYAIVADIDVGSEFMRNLGELRFELWGLWRSVFAPRNYPSKLNFNGRKVTDITDVPSSNSEFSDHEYTQGFKFLNIYNVPYISPGNHVPLS